MKYYTIVNNSLLTAYKEKALSRFYENVFALPSDYEVGKYIVKDNTLVLNQNFEIEKLKTLKDEKLTLALRMAYDAEENGSVTFKNASFETNTSNISKLTSQYNMLNIGAIDNVLWLSKDDIQVELNQNEILQLLSTISDYTGALWNVKYLSIKEQILNAKTTDELESIEIKY